jgi:phosphate transport system permease protein
MSLSFLFFSLLLLGVFAYVFGRKRALSISNNNTVQLHSLPGYYGFYSLLWCTLPALAVLIIWSVFSDSVVTHLLIADLPNSLQNLNALESQRLLTDVHLLAQGHQLAQAPDTDLSAAVEHYQRLEATSRMAQTVLVLLFAIVGLFWAKTQIKQHYPARNRVERVIQIILFLSSGIAVLTTLGIILSVLFESIHFFQKVPMSEFLLGTKWSPQTAIRSDQVGGSGSFGAIPLFVGTLLISFIAMLVAAPVGLMSAIYLSEYASSKVRSIVKPLLEILAGIPTVVYGFFAALTVAPWIRDMGEGLGVDVASESALAAGLVMGIMIIPFISSISDDVLTAVPQAMRDGSSGLGATKSETIRHVVIPAALPGIVGGLLLGTSRAIGETMIVVMAAGLAANLTANPLEAVTTVTVQIVTLLTGDQEFDSPKTLAAFALGLLLFITTLILNVIALHVVRKYREQYD